MHLEKTYTLPKFYKNDKKEFDLYCEQFFDETILNSPIIRIIEYWSKIEIEEEQETELDRITEE